MKLKKTILILSVGLLCFSCKKNESKGKEESVKPSSIVKKDKIEEDNAKYLRDFISSNKNQISRKFFRDEIYPRVVQAYKDEYQKFKLLKNIADKAKKETNDEFFKIIFKDFKENLESL